MSLDECPYVSSFASRVETNPIKQLIPFSRKEGMISLGAGLPPSDLFPIHSMSLRLTDGATVEVGAAGDFPLSHGLQYGPSSGYTPLLDWVTRYIQRYHHPQYEDWCVLLTTGNTDALFKVIAAVLDVGEVILADKFTYPPLTSLARLVQADCRGVEMDNGGMIPERLEEAILRAKKEGKRVKAMYTVPVGHNPAGCTLSRERKEALYEVCRNHGVLIIEDDPYYCLQFPNLTKPLENVTENDMLGMQNLTPSFLAFDRDGLVIRLGCASKSVAPGLRLGWVVCRRSIATVYERLAELSTQGVCGLSAAVFMGLLSHWDGQVCKEGKDGFHRHICQVQYHYYIQCRKTLDSANRHLKGLCQWTPPQGGMMLWIEALGISDIRDVFQELLENGVLVVPGDMFSCVPGKSSFLRVTFAISSPEKIDEAFKRIAEVLQKRKDEN
eukprot:Rmarinus@m.23907